MYMVDRRARQHPMKMVWACARELQGRFRRHEHGMDQARNLDELPRAFNPHMLVER
jgi:hypothetical protein